MNEINSRFKQAAEAAKSLPERPGDDTMLQLYAYYKQGSAGDVTGDKPGIFNFVAAAKYEAWKQLEGLSQNDAKNQYVDLVQSLGGKIDD